jgi:hypothetical protein
VRLLRSGTIERNSRREVLSRLAASRHNAPKPVIRLPGTAALKQLSRPSRKAGALSGGGAIQMGRLNELVTVQKNWTNGGPCNLWCWSRRWRARNERNQLPT